MPKKGLILSLPTKKQCHQFRWNYAAVGEKAAWCIHYNTASLLSYLSPFSFLNLSPKRTQVKRFVRYNWEFKCMRIKKRGERPGWPSKSPALYICISTELQSLIQSGITCTHKGYSLSLGSPAHSEQKSVPTNLNIYLNLCEIYWLFQATRNISHSRTSQRTIGRPIDVHWWLPDSITAIQWLAWSRAHWIDRKTPSIQNGL